ncbi:MAG TPA: response regulator [Chthoniobacterales bacterium]|nr:response regulator [Chthoniobacterales bacterium]
MPASQEFPAGTAPSVLLVEEYDALAAALTSALKKFAPHHKVHVAESLADAEAAAGEISPQLFIVDFDPPRADAVEFLGRLNAAHPSARFLAIGSGVPVEMNANRSGSNALQFIDKPFELAEFGAAVQALLGPWTNAASGDSRGTLRDLGVRDLIPLQGLNLATAVLHLRSSDDRLGEIHFLDGHITHAITGNFTGPGAVCQMLRWTNPQARETERVVEAPRTVHGTWAHVFFECLRQMRESPVEPPSAPPPAAIKPPKPVKAATKTGKKIVVIDDTEMLLIFVEDTLATADPSLQIVTAFTGSEGVRRAEVIVPDIILLDYSLPDLRGDQVCERLLQNEATARVPVLMMSGHVSEMAATARKYPNVVATIAKPFLSEALLALVKENLAKGPLPETPREPLPATPTPHGNGKKPAKKNGAQALKEAPEKILPPTAAVPSSPPPPVAPAQPVIPPPSAIPAPAPIAQTVVPPPAVEITTAPISRPPIPQAPVVPPPLPFPPPASPKPAISAPAASPLAAANGSTVVLGLGMEVVAVQFTPGLRVGVIRARPTASTLSLSHSSKPTENLLAGFQIGSVELDQNGRIHLMRVLPTRQPANTIQMRNQLQITQIALLNQSAPIELSAGQSAPMTMQLVALFKVAGVELSDRFEVEQLVLRPAHDRVRVSFDAHNAVAAGTEFETTQVLLDSSRRIEELLLSPALR